MRKILLGCCIILLANASSNAQTIQLTNGGSTTLSGANAAAPISAYYEYMRFQVVYTAAELNAAGITGPKTVSELGWYVSTAPASALPSYKIRMANTSATNSAVHDPSTLTEVYSVASYAPVAGGFDMLTLGGSFVWDGTSNLLVDVCFGAAPYASPYGEVRTYAATTTSGSRRVRCDACGSQCAINTSTTNTFKPQVSLTFSAPPSCLVPTGLNATAITSSSATVGWTAVGGATGYEYAVTTSAVPPGSGTATALTSIPVGSLSANTLYYLHVRTDCGGTFSGWATSSFTTSCNSTTVPYSENFDGVTAPAIPSCITVQNVNASNTWGNLATPAAVVIGAPNSMVYPYNSIVAADDWFFLQGLDLTAGTSYRLTFSWKSNPSFPESFEVKYGTGANAAAMTSGTLYTNASAASGTVVVQTADFIPGANGTYYIGFHCNSAADQDFLAIDNISVTLSPVCGDPTGLIAVPTGTGTTADLSWTAPVLGTPTGYEWAVTTLATPPASGTATALTTANASGLTAATQYYLHVRTDCGAGGFSSWATLPFTTLLNDAPCGAIPLTLGGPADCGNTAIATSTGDPGLVCSAPNNTVWYKYTPASTGTVEVLLAQNGGPAGQLNAWVQFYTATGTCPTLTLTQVNTGACTGNVDLTSVASGSLVSPVLTGGVEYYIMVDGFSGSSGAYCISLVAPPPPPACTTNLTPVNGATGVLIPGGATAISWNAAAGATSYDVYFGTVNPPTTNIGNTTATTVNITGLSYNTTYYWYVVPRNTGGPATGCDANTTSFTTENPTNCTPLYTTGCTSSDVISLFRIKGEITELNINTGAACNSSAYVDSTDHTVTIQMARGKSYWGQALCGFSDNYITIWIDGNDNGYFESTERLMSNLLVGSTLTNFNLFIPLTTPVGTHRMRVRNIYSGTAPTTPTDPCNPYTYGETEDYNVEVTAGGIPYTVSTYVSAGACYTGGGVLTVNSESNNNTNYVPLVDSTNNLIAQLYPQGNNLGRVSVSYYKHNGAVRQDFGGRYYLDRNITITTSVAPTAPYNLRLVFLNSELNALIAQPGSGVTSIFDLIATKNNDACLPALGNGGAAYFPTGFGSISGDRLIDFTGLNGFSSFYLHGGATSLPAGLLTFAGQKEGSVNKLRWTTTSEQNNRGFDVQRSTDGVNYVSIGFVNSLAVGGNSADNLNYTFVDNAPAGNKQYYRLRQLDFDGRSKLSNVVMIKGDKPVILTIEGLFPNPANSLVNVQVAAPVRDKVTLAVVDITGRTVLQKVIALETGSNTIPVDISQLTNGSYMVRLVCSGNCETAVGRFVKQ